ncbi:MAG: PEGA domain-containing protein [Desulfobacula sp.]|nr:PEGA domain-containing protein [Desulfobacula sp.]
MKTCPACGQQNKQEASICKNHDCLYIFNSDKDNQKTELYIEEKPFFSPGSFISERYEIVKELGRGGMGIVYLVKDIKLRDREVALKITHPELVSHEEARQRFKDEVILCLELLHPNIVRVNNLDEWNSCLYFTMEYIRGKNLRQFMDDRKNKKLPFTLSETIQLINPLLDALSYAHKTTIHRDIKPENILIQGDFPKINIKVLDFGIAKVLSASRFTRTAQSMGTAYYMSPEQMQGEKNIDHRSDLYSIGMLLYEMITGKIAAGRFKLPSELVEYIPPEIDEIVEKVLSPYPEDRFGNAMEMKTALSSIIEFEGSKERSASVQAEDTQRLKIKNYGALHVETNPSGAKIFLQSKPCGDSPINLNKVPCGNCLLKAEKENFESLEKEIEVVKDETIKIVLDMKPVLGSIYVDSEPSGANVWIDEKQIEQKTPINLNNIIPGEHSLKVVLDGYMEFEEKIQIIPEETSKFDTKLLIKKTNISDSSEIGKQMNNDKIDISEFKRPSARVTPLIFVTGQPIE